MRSYEIEYVVSGALDGTTLPPPFVPIDKSSATTIADPATPEGDSKLPDDDNIYRFDVKDLGLIDPDFGVGGAFGDRFISGLWINNSDNVPTPAVGVVSTRTRESTQEIITPGGLTSTFYRQSCIFVPQGSYLGIHSPDEVDDPWIVRMHIEAPENLEEYALLMKACCGQNLDDTVMLRTKAGRGSFAFLAPWLPGTAVSVDARISGVGNKGTSWAQRLSGLFAYSFDGASRGVEIPRKLNSAVFTGAGAATTLGIAGGHVILGILGIDPTEDIDWTIETDIVVQNRDTSIQ